MVKLKEEKIGRDLADDRYPTRHLAGFRVSGITLAELLCFHSQQSLVFQTPTGTARTFAETQDEKVKAEIEVLSLRLASLWNPH